MSLITDPQKLLTTITTAMANRKHWVLFTNSPEQHLRIGALIQLLLNVGLTSNDLDGGMVDVLSQETAVMWNLSVLMIPKRSVNRRTLFLLMKAAGFRLRNCTKEQDIVLLPSSEATQVDLVAAICAIHDGRAVLQNPNSN